MTHKEQWEIWTASKLLTGQEIAVILINGGDKQASIEFMENHVSAMRILKEAFHLLMRLDGATPAERIDFELDDDLLDRYDALMRKKAE